MKTLLKPGPKTEPFLDGTRARTLSLDDLTITMAKALSGEDNASKGIRAAVRFAFDLYQADRFIPGKTNGAPGAPGKPASPRRPPAPDAPPAPPDAPP